MQEWGLDVKEISISSAAVKYTEFLLATASGKVEGVKGPGKLATPFERTKVAAYTLGAMTPCMRLYAFIGKEFKALLDPKDDSHPYKKWIDNYSCESFQVFPIISICNFFSPCFYISSLRDFQNLCDIIFKLRHQLHKPKSCWIS